MYYVSLDVGQAADFSAVSVTEKIIQRTQEKTELGHPIWIDRYHVRHLQRYPLNTPYPMVIDQVGKMLKSPQLADKSKLLVDATGVGRPVVESMIEKQMKPIAILITGGDTESFDVDTSSWHVAKKILISNMLMLFGSGQLLFAEKLQEKQTVINELTNFKMKLTRAGNTTYEAWRESDHDDLVLSIAIGVWYAKRFGKPGIPKQAPPPNPWASLKYV